MALLAGRANLPEDSPLSCGVTGKDRGQWLAGWAVVSMRLFGPACECGGGWEDVLNHKLGGSSKAGRSQLEDYPSGQD